MEGISLVWLLTNVQMPKHVRDARSTWQRGD
jgi:hypothetical protein